MHNPIDILTLVSGILWSLRFTVLCYLGLHPRRSSGKGMSVTNANVFHTGTTGRIIKTVRVTMTAAMSAFPTLLLLMMVRSFAFEPFRVISGSMTPCLVEGDMILVKKFAYHIRNPISGKIVARIKTPGRGDVIVFKYPPEPELRYVKRITGLPGDVVTCNLIDNRILVEARRDPHARTSLPHGRTMPRDVSEHGINNTGDVSSGKRSDPCPGMNQGLPERKIRSGERYIETTSHLTHEHRFHTDLDGENLLPITRQLIPLGNYFVVGDNLSSSHDSRFWGLVPEENILGKVVAIWMSIDVSRGRSWPGLSFRPNRIGSVNHNLHTARSYHVGSTTVMEITPSEG